MENFNFRDADEIPAEQLYIGIVFNRNNGTMRIVRHAAHGMYPNEYEYLSRFLIAEYYRCRDVIDSEGDSDVENLGRILATVKLMDKNIAAVLRKQQKELLNNPDFNFIKQ